MKKKVLMSLILLAIIGTSAVFAQTPTLDKLTFTKSNTYVIVNLINRQTGGDVVIPDTYDGLPVQSISASVMSNFRGNPNITSVVIPASINDIGMGTFLNSPNLTRVTFLKAGITISSSPAGFDGDLRAKYMAGGVGTYTRTAGSNTWTRTGDAPVAPPVVNTSIEGIWVIGTTQIRVSGNAGVFSNMGTLSGRQLDAFNKGYIKVGDQFWRNLRSTGNLTWSGEHLVVYANDRTPNVATGINWANATFTMSADGLTLTITSTAAGTGTYTRR